MVLLIESLSRHHIFGGVVFLVRFPVAFLMNWLIIATFLALTYLIPKRVFAQTVVAIVFVGLGIINCVLLYTRVTPFEAVDFSILRTGISIVGIYLTTLQIILCVLAILAAVALLVILLLRSPKSPVRPAPAALSFLEIGVCATALIVILSVSGVIPARLTDVNEAYDRFGFTYCFSRSIFDRGIAEPVDYSKYSIDEILASIGGGEDKQPEQKPNVIFVQLESFMDLNYFRNLTFEKNPVANFEMLKETCSSGLLYVPSVGAGTANTEFEVLTGMNLDEFGTGEYPFKTILQTKSCESICYNLRELGYTSHGFHNNTGTFYNRNIVYEMLGFDVFTPIEYMSGYPQNPVGWAKDTCLTEQILSAMKKTEKQDFVFAVSVQGHGKYPSEPVEGEELIRTYGIENEALRHQFEFYAYQMWEMDQFIGELVEALSAFPEDCVLVLYGDHQPSLEYELEDISLASKYMSEYVIWTNFESAPVHRDLEAYQLSAQVMELLGMDNGLLTKLHQRYRDNVDYLRALQMLQYDMLYGDMLAYGGGEEYPVPEMKMGEDDIVIRQITCINDVYYVVGEQFTASSEIYVNGHGKSTEFISNTVLLLSRDALRDGDTVTVRQITTDFVELGSSNEFIYEEAEVDKVLPGFTEDDYE